MTATQTRHNVVSREEWLKARLAHLADEKELTRKRDEVSRQRRELPWEKVEKNYVFEGPNGPETLVDLFGGRSQLVIYHFMLGPNWEEGCKSCSFLADHFDATLIHLAHRDVTLAVVSQAPLARIQAFQKRMGWRFPWVSAFQNDFQRDYGVHFTKEELAGEVNYNYGKRRFGAEEAPGLSVFYKDERGEIFHTYSTYGRGLDALVGTYTFLDFVPKGRDEDGLAFTMSWVRHHDRYDENYAVDPTAGYQKPREGGSCCKEEGGAR
ncbi:MAG TPA: thioredoxin family protein [Bryobacteraceae bacterium]|nr:thioredoxin family protein [Bryobacteraceae bacterium]